MTLFILIDEFGDVVQTPILTPAVCNSINQGLYTSVIRVEDGKFHVREYVGQNKNDLPYYEYMDIQELDLKQFKSE